MLNIKRFSFPFISHSVIWRRGGGNNEQNEQKRTTEQKFSIVFCVVVCLNPISFNKSPLAFGYAVVVVFQLITFLSDGLDMALTIRAVQKGEWRKKRSKSLSLSLFVAYSYENRAAARAILFQVCIIRF